MPVSRAQRGLWSGSHYWAGRQTDTAWHPLKVTESRAEPAEVVLEGGAATFGVRLGFKVSHSISVLFLISVSTAPKFM